MFTWNLLYISKKRLEDTLSQLMVDDGEDKDVLIRIHTAVHSADEAVDLAAFIKGIIPKAKILGTSTSAIISEGKLIHDQCVVSVTQMDEGNVITARIPLTEDGSDLMISAEKLCDKTANLLIHDNTRLLFVFSPEQYRDIERFVEISNDKMPSVQMIGGVVDRNDIIGDGGFVFDENGWSGQEMIIAALNGDSLECLADSVTGVQVVGDLYEITKVKDNHILEIDGKTTSEFIVEGIGEEVAGKPDFGFYFPLIYNFNGVDVPFVYGYSENTGLGTNHAVTVGRKLRRGFFYDRKIIADNRSAYDRIESFDKGETLFSYACKDRFRIYPNSVKWELSAYQNSNISGCLTRGEISVIGGRNIFTNCAFVFAVAGENLGAQQMNPYAFSHTQVLEEDNHKLIEYLTDATRGSSRDDDALKESMRSFVNSCSQMIFYSKKDNIANEAALHMDICIGGFDRVCVIDVPEKRSIRTAFSEQSIKKTHSHLMAECTSFATRKNYRMYMLTQWQMAIAVPSYMVSLEDFTEDMKSLQKQLFETEGDNIPIVTMFCIIDECNAENISSVIDAARMEMTKKNIQFYVCNGKEKDLDEKSILEKYHMVNVINYALSHNGVVPYYQGIYDNKENKIHHYESLMRLKDETGKVYPPFAFLDVARSYGLLYDALSREMIRKVFDTFANSKDQSVSINLGIRDIKNEDMTRYIYSFLSTAPYPENFVFEILEDEDVDEYETLLQFVNNIHKLGSKVSIDDFGSGYSNLQHLLNIAADFLKIDGSIVKECCNSKDSANLIRLISSWRRLSSRDTSIIAEYVENEEIQDKLLQFNIDFSQGYLFSKPNPETPVLEDEQS